MQANRRTFYRTGWLVCLHPFVYQSCCQWIGDCCCFLTVENRIRLISEKLAELRKLCNKVSVSSQHSHCLCLLLSGVGETSVAYPCFVLYVCMHLCRKHRLDCDCTCIYLCVICSLTEYPLFLRATLQMDFIRVGIQHSYTCTRAKWFMIGFLINVHCSICVLLVP